ncbi:MAG: hypothetical protein E7595_01320 [Ruminococcaceae bacterium]|nr:hypothetical protein [Oscillospiraceae bacterium]
MKKLLPIILLITALLLCACSGESAQGESELYGALCSAIGETNSFSRLSGEYMLEITFGDSVTLYYALGNVAFDRESLSASAEFTQTYLGDSSKAANYASNGKTILVDDGVAYETGHNITELMQKFPYARIMSPNDESKITVSESRVGKSYSVVLDNSKEISEMIIGSDLYELASVIKKPQPEKTQYGEISCIYTISENKVVACRYEYDVKLFDTPSYVPGYSVPEDEYTLDIHIVAKISYTDFGSEAEIKEFEGSLAERADENSQISS